MGWLLIKNFLGKWWPYIVIAILGAIGLYLVYNAGYNKAKVAGDLHLSKVMQAAAEESARNVAIARGRDLAHASELAKIEQEGVQNAEKVREGLQKTVDDLNSGNLRLRKRLAAVESTNGVPGSTPATGVDSGRSVQTIGLRVADAAFLVRRSDDADLRANALKTCVEIAQKDRTMLMDWYKSHGTKP